MARGMKSLESTSSTEGRVMFKKKELTVNIVFRWWCKIAIKGTDFESLGLKLGN